MRNFAMITVLFFGFALTGCYDLHGHVPPVITMGDAGVVLGDAGMMLAPDAVVAPDSDPTNPDAGTDAFVPEESVLTVSLGAATPPGMTLPRDATGVSFTVFDFTTSDAPEALMGFEARRVGVGAASDISNVYLVDAFTGARLSTGRSVNTTTNTASFHFWPAIEIPAHTVWSVVLVGEFDAAISGGQHAFEITDADAVWFDSAEAASGDFPVRGSVFTIGTHLAPRLDVRLGASASEAHVGDRGVEVANFTLGATGDVIDILRVNLLHAGSASRDDLTPTAAIVDADHRPIAWLTASWDAAGFLVIQPSPGHLGIGDGGTTSISVFMDINGPAGRTIRLYVEYPVDVVAVVNAATSWSPTAVCISRLATGGCTSDGQGSYDGTVPGTYSEVVIR